ncbi:MAG: hypothetical protein ABDH20_11170 [Thermus sp.]
MERLLESDWLVTSDVGRRLGVQGGTVRHYGEILRRRGYPFRQGEGGEWLWAPETAEVARAAHALARATPGLSFERALDLVEYAGRIAQKARSGTTLPEVLGDLRDLPKRLREAFQELEERLQETGEAGRALEEQVRVVATRLGGAVEGTLKRLERGVDSVLGRVESEGSLLWMGWWVGPVLLLVQSLALVLLVLGRQLPEWILILGVLGLLLLGRWSARLF